MGGATINVLPRDSELARRAAGGDGTAFLRLYDRYAADVFEAALTAGGSVELAADATQSAFLTLLRHPPAIDARDAEVIDRLRRMALAAEAQGSAATGAGVGWLRSETVAKAGARFDADWSIHLASAGAAGRTPAEVAFAWQSRPARTPNLRPERRRLSLPIPAVRVGLPALGAAAALALVVAAGGADRPPANRTETLASIEAVRLAPLRTIAEPRERPRRRRSAGAPRREPAVTAGAAEAPEEPVIEVAAAQPLEVASTPRGHAAPVRAPAAGETLGVTQEAAPGRERVRGEAPGAAPRPPAASPAPPDAAPPAAPAPAPTPSEPGSATGQVRRNCKSKRALNSC